MQIHIRRILEELEAVSEDLLDYPQEVRASFIAFTGTPIEPKDANTRAVFRDYIGIYDIKQAVDDHTAVNIYYEGRLAKLGLDPLRLPSFHR